MNFTYYAPTEVVFGDDAERHTAEMLRKYGATKILLHYGGHSAQRSGLLDTLRRQLTDAGLEFIELGGVVPNPRLSKVREGIALCREHGVDFILAVGGGSVIDSAKAIGYGIPYQGDVWDIYARRAVPQTVVPVGVVLTIPAAGSEMSNSSVITAEGAQGEDLKRGYTNNLCRPRFAIMNPRLTFTLPPYQTACGVVDILMHTLERYFTRGNDMALTDALAESLMRTVIECGPKVLADPHDYAARASIMWASSLSHNDLTANRDLGDWATHGIEHELSGLYDVAHGAGLAAVWPAWALAVMDHAPERFTRLAVNVFGVPYDFTSTRNTALAGIRAAMDFFRRMDMPVNITELLGGRPASDEDIDLMARKCTAGGPVGRLVRLDTAAVASILHQANTNPLP